MNGKVKISFFVTKEEHTGLEYSAEKLGVSLETLMSFSLFKTVSELAWKGEMKGEEEAR